MTTKNRFPVSFLGIALMTALMLLAPSGHASAKEAKHGEGGEGGEGKGSGVVSMDPIIVNLASDRGRRYLKVTIQIEPAKSDTSQQITSHQAEVIDALITVLSSKSADEVLSVEGKLRLKEQILIRLNVILDGGVKNVFFVEFVIQ